MKEGSVNKKTEILIVEDEREIVENLRILLTEEGFSVCAAANRKTAVEILEERGADLILLDLMLPDGSGYSLCSAIKKERDIPVIMLTAMDDEASVVTGFDLGADDYVTKPFRPMELVSRIRNVLRRSEKRQMRYMAGNLSLDVQRAYVEKNGKEIYLSPLEYRLLLIFFQHQGEVLGRNRLLEEIWDIAGDFVSDNTLTVYIKRLREKVEDDPAHPALIKTVRGLGYRMEG
ncbi:MAG TPA: response regulator transcription factor [Candidatus Anaerobutyricum avicola]|nr:response regulator transcription factor [Candidatus Anaerobutyricum avicola]